MFRLERRVDEVEGQGVLTRHVVEIEMTRGINEVETSIRRLVGSNVKAAREYAGLSQRELAERAGIGQAYLSQCESGKWNIGIDNIARIARSTGFLPHDLMHPKFDPVEFTASRRRTKPRTES